MLYYFSLRLTKSIHLIRVTIPCSIIEGKSDSL